MSRNSGKIIRAELNAPSDLNYGLFLASIKKVNGNTVILKDKFSQYDKLSITFDIKNEYDQTLSGKDIWLNQCGQIGYGKEENLFENFTGFIKNGVLIKPKKYWKALKGECDLFRFLTALHGYNIYDISTDYTLEVIETDKYHKLLLEDEDFIRRLINNPYGLDSSIGGVLYITPDFKEKIHNYFFPESAFSFLKNIKGNFINVNSKDIAPPFKPFFDNVSSIYCPEGYFNWNNIEPFIMNIKSTDL